MRNNSATISKQVAALDYPVFEQWFAKTPLAK